MRFPERADYLDIGTEPGAPRFTQDEILAELPRHLARPTYNAGRASFRTYLAREAGLRARRGADISATAVDNAVERVWPSLTPQSFLRDLLGSRERLLAAAGEAFTAADVNKLLRPAAERLSDEPWGPSDVALLDEADELINGKPSQYAHIVVDEAQDLSPMQLRSVARRSRDGSMTIVGDLAQSTGPWARDTWDDVVDLLQSDCEPEMAELALGYRVPQQVFEFAAQLLPYAAPELTPPRVVRRGPAEPELVESHPADLAQEAVLAARAHAGNGRFVGIICPEHVRGSIIAELQKRDVTWGDVGAGQLDKAINVARPSESKGLEFDAVVVVDPVGIVEEAERGHRMLYVALTRTTRYLTVVHTGKPMPIPTHGWFPDDVKARTVVRTVAEPPSAGVRIQSTAPRSAAVRDHHKSPAGQPARSPDGQAVPDLREVVLRAAGASLADQIRASVTPEQWPALLEALRFELGITEQDAPSDQA